ncbi:dTDP-4-dehydrorhamnose reductase [Sphingobium cloacae]|uniref:dTDP-4-dehydrorhamnose reductase n=1 Tax=Sphingobium cloacae TaxID=120107 RepID=A0A1E1F368_9SPHN|nr:dTDP-4-dehydrorhamnose reductase [Sphingobium cloacae]BAV64979.1 dTDP-4-dehydrorhamnose reductase [Sphingobium cloacae]
MRTILVTGGAGQLGTALRALPLPQGWSIHAADRTTLDLRDSDAIGRFIARGHHAAVINAGAYTDVDGAETDVVEAWRINALAPAALAAACAEAGIPLVHVSTDYVFDGDGDRMRQPHDPVRPLGVYGASKAAGEMAVTTAGGQHAIVRTAWLVSAHGHNFVRTMLRLAAERDSIGVVSDQRGSPTSAADLARALAAIAMGLALDPEAPAGIYHFSNRGAVSWADFARVILAGSAARGGPRARIENIASSAYPMRARRPARSLLCTQAIERDYGIVPRPWEEALDEILDQLMGKKL